MHTAEFKAKVGLEAVRWMKTITEIAQACNVHPQLVGNKRKVSWNLHSSAEFVLLSSVALIAPYLGID